MDIGVSELVRGSSGETRFLIHKVKSEISETASMTWVLLSAIGSALSWTLAASRSRVGSPTVAATLVSLGKS